MHIKQSIFLIIIILITGCKEEEVLSRDFDLNRTLLFDNYDNYNTYLFLNRGVWDGVETERLLEYRSGHEALFNEMYNYPVEGQVTDVYWDDSFMTPELYFAELNRHIFGKLSPRSHRKTVVSMVKDHRAILAAFYSSEGNYRAAYRYNYKSMDEAEEAFMKLSLLQEIYSPLAGEGESHE